MKKITIGFVIALIIAGGSLVAFFPAFSTGKASGKPESQAKSIETIHKEQGKPVMVDSVTQKDIHLVETFYGNVVPFAQANVQGKYGGRLTLLNGNEGDAVNKGDVIVGFDTTDIQLNLAKAEIGKNITIQSVAQAESNYETIKTDLSRMKKLFAQGITTKQKLDSLQNQFDIAGAALLNAREQVKNAEAEISLLNNTLKEMTIAAPVSGIIDKKNFNLNEISGGGAAIYHIVALDKVYIEVNVPESYITHIEKEMEVSVILDSIGDKTFAGIIDQIIPTGNPQNRNFIVKVLVENPDLLIKPGMFARIDITLESISDAFVFNKKALLKEGNDYYIFKVSGNRAEKIPVDIKHRNNHTVSVLSKELKPTDRIVVEGARFLDTNDLIKVIS